jgi:uncharacterized peroxidase-related enzyme
MSFLNTLNEQSASDTAARLREEDRAAWGFVPNFAETFCLRPAVYQAWKNLNAAIKESMDLRRYELATVAAASALRSSYCTLAHGRILARDFIDSDDVARLVAGDDDAELAPVDRAIVALARKVALRADQITEADIDELRSHGLKDEEIFDVVLSAAARCFFSKSLDATGTTPDSAFHAFPDLEPALRQVLTVGRPIDV